MIENLAIITYTHSSMRDIWPMYFGEMDRYLTFIKNHYILCDQNNDIFRNKKVFTYSDEKEFFYEQYNKVLECIEEDFVLMMMEDQIIYDPITEKNVMKYLDFLNRNKEFSFLKTFKTDIHEDINIENDIYLIPNSTSYVFSMQPVIWKKKDLYNLLNDFKMKSFKDEILISKYMKSNNINGVYIYNGEKKIGRQHFESSVFPIMEVIGKGKWIMYYPEKMIRLFRQYGINPLNRGQYRIL